MTHSIKFEMKAQNPSSLCHSIMKSISQQTQNDILTLLDQGKSCRKIALEIGVHYSTVSRLCSQHCSTIPKAQGGRPSKLNSTTIHHAIHIISTGRADTAVQVAKSLQETFPGPVSSQTVQRALKKTGLKAVVKAKRPALSKCHHREVGLCQKPPALDCGGLEEGHLVRWEGVGMEEEWGRP